MWEFYLGSILLIPAVISHSTSLPSFMMLSWLVVYYVSCGISSIMM
jgi:hypothetical protein